ncbi:MAG: acyltransferase family protein [Rhizobiaceae bacterium]
MRSALGNARHAGVKADRIDWVDYAKGFCIIFVVMMHSTLGVEKAAGTEGWMHYLVQFAKPFRMPDFFMISGLFLGLVIARPILRYVDRKVVHFLYFYVLWLCIQFVLKIPGWMGEGETAVAIAAKFGMSFIEPFGTLWFIYMLPVFFLVTRALRSVHWAILVAGAALLEILPIHTGWLMIDEFASRYVYFLAGYLFVTQIFTLADWARGNRSLGFGLLAVWFAVNLAATFTEAPQMLVTYLEAESGPLRVSDLPVLSFLLGIAGAVAVIVFNSILSTVRFSAFLGYLGKNSIVVYLAFFLPMAISRAVLLRFAPFLDIGTVSLLVTIAGVTGPVVLHAMIQWSGYGKFLFERPDWARLEKPARQTPAAYAVPAE